MYRSRGYRSRRLIGRLKSLFSKRRMLYLFIFLILVVMVSLGGVCIGYWRNCDACYSKGFKEGKAQGYSQGYEAGFSKGKSVGISEGYSKGFNEGRKKGFSEGVQAGFLGTIVLIALLYFLYVSSRYSR